jgi:hypothetical protein
MGGHQGERLARFVARNMVGLNVALAAGGGRLVCVGGSLAGVRALALSTLITSAGEGSLDTSSGSSSPSP